MPVDTSDSDDSPVISRTGDQIAADSDQTRDQVLQLGAPRPGFRRNPELDSILRSRHDEKEGALKFDIVGGQKDGEALAVSGDVLVPEGSGRSAADVWLTSNGFERRAPAADDPHCAPLEGPVWLYSFTGPDDAARKAVDLALTENAAGSAVRHGVSALHMVVKSTDGPAPTSVTVASFSEEDAALAWAQGQIRVAVIDTGIDEHLRGDGWLNDVWRNLSGGDDDNVDELDVFPVNALPGTMPILDFGAGHGTFVAGIVRQVDPEARIVAYRALDTDGLASEKTLACAMIRAAHEGAHVINVSAGMEAVDGIIPPYLQTAVNYIQDLPIPPVIVASAGNNGTTEPVYPAAFEDVVAVAALRAGAERDPATGELPGAEWSSSGSWVDCSAVGEGIVSTFVKGKEDLARFGDDDVYPENEEGDSWAVWSGTSFAAPQIAALVAKKCRDDGLPPQAAMQALFPRAGRPADGFGTRMTPLEGTPPSQ